MSMEQPSFEGLRVAALESRRREDMERLIQRFGGQPFVSASMREVPLDANREVADFANRLLTGEVSIVILMTGVGFRHLLAAAERVVDRQRFLNALADITTIARGPKPVAAMRDVGLQPTYRVPEPNTWRELVKLLDEQVPLANHVVGLQEYGICNSSLIASLENRGASVIQVRVYQWELPEDIGPLEENLRAILAGERDLLLLTSAHQLVNLFQLAEKQHVANELKAQLRQLVLCSIGPTTSEMIQHYDLQVDLEPEHPKMGHLVQAAAERGRHLLEAKRWRLRATSRPPATPDASGSSAETVDPYQDAPFMRACRGQAASVTPIWLMRQAGRYMSEYRAVREKVGFLDLCKNPALCAEVMVTAVNRLGVDAAIIFSDLLPILEPMGMNLEFSPGDGPVIHNPIRSGQDIARVHALENMEPLRFVADTVRMTRAALPNHIPVIGFAGAPFTLASYMIEGGGSKSFAHTKQFMYSDPGAWHALMQRLVASISLYLNEQILAGAQVVQIFDSWAGCLSPGDYGHYVYPYMKILIDSIIPDTPVINFATGNPCLLRYLRGDRRTVVGLDWRVRFEEGWAIVGHDRPVQGNLDPTVLLGDRETIRRQANGILEEAAGRPGHIFNLGHGILPQTPVDNVIALIDHVHEKSSR